MEGEDLLAALVIVALGRVVGLSERSHHADESDADVAIGADGAGSEVGLVGAQVLEVAADDLGVEGMDDGVELLHAIVELMVAHGGQIVAGLVHQGGDTHALGGGTVDTALREVSQADERYMGCFGQRMCTQGGDLRIAFDMAVHIVVEQQNNLLLLCRLRLSPALGMAQRATPKREA